MISLYFLPNSFEIEERKRIFSAYIPLKIKLSNSVNPFLNTGCIRYITSKDLTEIKFDVESKKLISLTIVSSENIFFNQKEFETHGLMELCSALLIGSNVSFETEHDEHAIPTYDIHQATSIVVYDNALLLYLPINKTPKYYIHETAFFGALVDKDFGYCGFVIWNLLPNEVKEMRNFVKNYLPISPINPHKELIKAERPLYMLKKKTVLIKKILELNNINFWELLFYGLERNIIDANFCTDFAISYLSTSENKQNLAVEIVGALKSETIPQIFSKEISYDLVMIGKGQFYNKVWLYLSLTLDMSELELID